MNCGSTIRPFTSGGRPQKSKPLLLTVDDPSRKLLGAVFVPTDTTWNHFEHLRRLFLPHRLPLVVYTDGPASLAMIPWPMIEILVPSSNAPSPLWA